MTVLADSLSRLDQDRTWLEPRMAWEGPAWEGPAWRRVADTTSIIDALWHLEAKSSDDSRAIAAMVMWRHAHVASLAVWLFALERRVPELDPGTISIAPHAENRPVEVALGSAAFTCLADDPAAGGPAVATVADLDALRGVLVARVERFVAPVVEPLRARSHLGAKAQWGLAATVTLLVAVDVLAESGHPDAAVEELDLLLAQAGPLRLAPPVVEVVRDDPGAVDGDQRILTTWGACCLSYRRVPAGGQCDACPLLSREERLLHQR